MKPMIVPKKSASFSYGLGVAKIVAGVPVLILSLILFGVGTFFINESYLVYYLFPILLNGLSLWLLYSGAATCELVKRFQKVSGAMQFKNRENMKFLAQLTGQNLTRTARDLRYMADKGFFPGAFIDLDRGEFVLEQDNKPAPVLCDGDTVLRERKRLPLTPLLAFPVILGIYALMNPAGAMYQHIIVAALAAFVCVAAAIKAPRVCEIREEQVKLPPPPAPAAINTGDEALDEFLTDSMGYMTRLNELSLLITNEKMARPIGELLNLSRQIFAFVERQPEKIRQTRQFMGYYLPTTIKLLQSYGELSRQPHKGDSIMEATRKIEESMGGIVETFKYELDNLYRDRAEDIAVDIDVMLAIMRQQGISNDFPDIDK